MVAEKRIVGKSVCNQRENGQKEYNDARMGTNRTRINSNREKRQQIYQFAIDTFILGVLFATVAYQVIPWAVRYESDFEYCLLWIVSLIMGVCTTPPTKYSSATIVGIIIVPYALDCIMAYHRERFSLVLLLCLLGMCNYFIMVIWQCYPVVRTGRNRKKWPQYLMHFVYRSKILMTGILLAMLVVFSITGLISNYVVQREQKTNVSTEKINSILSTMDNNAEIVSNLDAGRWNTLSRDRQLSTMQEIVDIECKHLGIPYPLTVTLKEMSDESILGSYSHKQKMVNLNTNVFDEASGTFLVSTLLHEVYHAYQYTVLDLYEDTGDSYRNLKIFEKVPTYSNEFEHYISGVVDYDGYMGQLVEQDSEKYAMLRMQDYITLLNYIGDCKDGAFN